MAMNTKNRTGRDQRAKKRERISRSQHSPRLVEDRQQLRRRRWHPPDDHLFAVRRAHADGGDRTQRRRIRVDFRRATIAEHVRTIARNRAMHMLVLEVVVVAVVAVVLLQMMQMLMVGELMLVLLWLLWLVADVLVVAAARMIVVHAASARVAGAAMDLRR